MINFSAEQLTDALLLYLLIFTRMVTISMCLPIFGAQLLPSLVRVGLAGLLSAVMFVVVHHASAIPADMNIFIIAGLFLKEALLGFILGFFASMIFYAYEMFGELIDFARAASMARMLVPELKQQSSTMGVLFFQFSLTCAISLGLHREIIYSLANSFNRFPIFAGVVDPHDHIFLATIELMNSLFAIALRFALPIVLICFLIDLAFGLVNRVAPQVNAYFLSLPAKIMGGLIMLLFLLPFVMDDFADHYRDMSQFFKVLTS